MTRPYVLSKQQYACRCGSEHPLHEQIRIAGIPVLLCPECPDDALHVYFDKTNGVRLIMGDSGGPAAVAGRLNAFASRLDGTDEAWFRRDADLHARLANVQERLDALEAKRKRGAKE